MPFDVVKMTNDFIKTKVHFYCAILSGKKCRQLIFLKISGKTKTVIPQVLLSKRHYI